MVPRQTCRRRIELDRDASVARYAGKFMTSFFRAAIMVALFCFLWVACMLNLTHQALGDGKKLPSEPLWIVSANGPVEFDVEVARTDQQKARGLMFRRSLPQGKGMLFAYKAAANHTMWMRNTYIPLDMIFIRVDGRVHRIEARTEPFSERIIAAGAPVTAVLEIAGGEAERLGLRPGDLVRHAWFGTADD